MIDAIFCNLNRWRHFPNYQLERRADIFFSVYLAEVMSEFLNTEIREPIIPEFPIKKEIIGEGSDKQLSVKADYLCVAEDLSVAYLVELKTDIQSESKIQERRLQKASSKGLYSLLEGACALFRVTDANRKYYHLLSDLERLGLISLPPDMHRLARNKKMTGLAMLYDKIEINQKQPQCDVIYVTPNSDKENYINFEIFASVVGRHKDNVSQLFSKSLKEWANNKAGMICT